MTSLIGYYTTKFGELWDKSLFDLAEEAIDGVLKATNLENKQIDAVFFGNMLAGVLGNNLHSTSKLAEILKINVPIFRTEAACASGGTAFNLAKTYLDSNSNKNVLVIGAEKMTDYSPEEVITALSAAASGEEQEAGLTFSGLYAMMANFYLEKYHYTEKNLAYVSVKNHYHGSLNDKAQFRRKITVEDVLKSAYVSYPLKVLDSSPISDGASAVVLTNNHDMIKKQKYSTAVLASEVITDTISLKSRKQIDEILATKIASDKAFKMAKIKRSDINVAELHDCFSIAEILAMEDLGFWKKGTGGQKITEESTTYGNGGNLIVNSSGGLKASGHPVGATGIKQIGEIFLQLTGQANNRQVKNAKYGLAHNVGGSGGTAVVTILSS
ncbi:acetyl-CoA acetyltransferase [Candidatus Roizmanbacteria bacterium CG_4_9_14_3_um_filter_33_18]|uniref:Acetyl-CoA acetyltransferase n=1 Tax=Candidatus Roizmanbacteria bacterium CG_4_9_14_3_um_filter_33_18 TaxID=1974841 RepID=A0A2M7XWP3_9BACT|nr:MAG: acetyl-CoA acetyltransferase [Candidatus Roizmanbacteria bacterium CG_4_9_14_3_um_filter_33_18]